MNLVEGDVFNGESIGDIVPFQNNPNAPIQNKLAYKVGVIYSGKELVFSPTLFLQQDEIWLCVVGSPYDCEPEQFDYIDECKP